jgi:hypothetical protein
VGVTEKKKRFQSLLYTWSAFTISVPDPNSAKWGFSWRKAPRPASSPATPIVKALGQKFSGNIKPLTVSK